MLGARSTGRRRKRQIEPPSPLPPAYYIEWQVPVAEERMARFDSLPQEIRDIFNATGNEAQARLFHKTGVRGFDQAERILAKLGATRR